MKNILIITLALLCSSGVPCRAADAPATVPAASTPPESVIRVSSQGNTIRIDLGGGQLELVPVSAGMVRLEYRAEGKPGQLSELIDPALPSLSKFDSVSLQSDPVVVKGERYQLEVNRSPFQLRFRDQAGNLLFQSDAVAPLVLRGSAVAGTYFGFHKNDRGLSFTGKAAIDPKSQGHACSPFLWTTQGFGVYVDADKGNISWEPKTRELAIDRTGSINPNLLTFLMAGTPREIMADFYRAAGRFAMPPRWTMGFMNSQYEMTEAEMRESVATYRAKQIPLDAFILDIDWFVNTDKPGQYRWSGKFPTGANGVLRRDMDAAGVKLVGIRKPFARGHLQGPIMELSDPEVRRSFWANYLADTNHPFATGIIAYWNDQADEFNERRPPFPHLQHLHMQKAQYEGQRALTNQRVWSINRNFLGGAQRYAYGLWSGDIRGGYGSIAAQRAAMLSSINLGAAWWGMDIGSYFDQPLPEEYYRWMQFGAFAPIYRVHGRGGMKRQPWKYGPDGERIAKAYIELRYRLVPYLYSSFWRLHREGLPVVRPLVQDYPGDTNVYTRIDAWMFGDSILPVPVVTEAATNVSFYLPAGQWFDFWDNQPLTGAGLRTRAVEPETIPIYIKAGSIVPLGPVMQYIGEQACDPIELRVYPGADARFVLYEDDGQTYDYEKGVHAEIPITWDEATQTLTIAARQGSYPGMLAERTFHVTVARPGKHFGPAADSKPDAVLAYKGQPVSYAHDSFRLEPAGEIALQAAAANSPAQATVTIRSSGGRKLPVIKAKTTAQWLTAEVKPTGATSIVQLVANPAGLPSGIHSTRVELSGVGYADTALDVRLRVDGAPRPVRMAVTPAAPVLTRNGKLKFAAVAQDQFDAPFTGPMEWTVSGGGGITPEGEFQSDGRAGEFTVTARATGHSEPSAKATVRVGDWIPGLRYTNYLGRIKSVTEIAGLKAHATGTQKNFAIERFPQDNEFAFSMDGLLDVPETGEYVLHLSTHDGSQLSIDNKLVIDNDGVHRQTRSVQLALQAGLHPIKLQYFKVDHPKVTTGNAVSLKWTPPRLLKRASLKQEKIPDTLLWHIPDPKP